jgi:prevent-host-death family protein
MVMDSSITATKAKATLLAVLDEVARTGRPVTVTKYGKPVADIVPHLHAEPYDLVGTVRQLVGDDELIAPFDDEWTGDAANVFGEADR